MHGYHELIRAAVELYTKEQINLQRSDMMTYAFKYMNKHPVCQQQQSEFLNLFTINNIDPLEFSKSVYDILNKKHLKKNCLRLVGIPNSCKTLIANCIVAPFICCYNNNHGSENEFYLSNMLNKSIILCEELYITVATCEDFKSVLGGQVIDIAKKYNEKQLLCRTPVIITSNHYKFGRGHISDTDENALCIRCYNYNFIKTYQPTVTLDTYNFYYFLFNYLYP